MSPRDAADSPCPARLQFKRPRGLISVGTIARRLVAQTAMRTTKPAQSLAKLPIADLKALRRETKGDLRYARGVREAAKRCALLSPTYSLDAFSRVAADEVHRLRSFLRAIRAALFCKELADTADCGHAVPAVPPSA